MSLNDYETVTADLERQPASEGVFVWAGILRSRIENALWQPHARPAARKLAARLRAVEDNSAVAAGVASPDWQG